MSISAIILLIVTALSLVGWALLHGKTIKVNIIPKMLDTALLLLLLWCGGFFTIQ